MTQQEIGNKLKEILKDPDFHLFELTDFCVARTKGRLTISKETSSFSIDYTPDGNFFEGISWLAESMEEAIEMIMDLSKSVYIHQQMFLVGKELALYQRFCECLIELWGYDKECYVCEENAYCFMTECRHSICIYCFQKCFQNDNKQFTCGVCRHTVSFPSSSK
jgi:hypothetical protein